MDWIFDNRRTIYLLLAAVAIVVAAIWWRTHSRKCRAASILVLLLLLLFTVVDLFLRKETSQEQIERKIGEIALAARHGANRDKVQDYVSDSFHSPSGNDKAAFLKEVANLSDRFEVTDVNPWDFRNITIDRSKRTATVRFNVSVKYGGNGENKVAATCEVDFVLEDDDQWRMKSYRVFLPNTSEPVSPQWLP